MTHDLERLLETLRTSTTNASELGFLKRVLLSTRQFNREQSELTFLAVMKEAGERIRERSVRVSVDGITNFWQAMWLMSRVRNGQNIEVPRPDIDLKTLEAIEDAGRVLIYLPPEFSGDNDWRQIARNFYASTSKPENDILYESQENSIHKDLEYRRVRSTPQSGWMHTEHPSASPNKGVSPEEFARICKVNGYMGMSLNTYLAYAHSSYYYGRPVDSEHSGWSMPSQATALSETRADDIFVARGSTAVGHMSVELRQYSEFIRFYKHMSNSEPTRYSGLVNFRTVVPLTAYGQIRLGI